MQIQPASFCKVFLIAFGLAGCGLTVPDIKEIWDTDMPEDPATQTPKVPGAAQIEFEIKKRVYCDLKEAVQAANHFSVTSGQRSNPLLPSNWGAQVSLSLQVDEVSGLSPGVALNQVLPNALHVFGPGTTGTVTSPQSFSLGFGGTLSSTA